MLVEPLLQPALELQAIARIHRIGQTQDTTVFQYVVNNTVDERIALLSLEKKNHRLFAQEQASIYALLDAPGADGPTIDLGTTAAVPTGPASNKKGKGPLTSADSNTNLVTTNEGLDHLSRVLFEKPDRINVNKLQARSDALRAEAALEEARAEQRREDEYHRATAESRKLARARLSRAGSGTNGGLRAADIEEGVARRPAQDAMMELSSDTEDEMLVDRRV